MKKIKIITLLFLFALVANCKGGASEADLKSFIISQPKTIGWKTASDVNLLDFFPDGRIHIQGPEGESTMWEGKWSIQGDQIKIERGDTNKTETLPIKIEGDNLNIGGIIYTRVPSVE